MKNKARNGFIPRGQKTAPFKGAPACRQAGMSFGRLGIPPKEPRALARVGSILNRNDISRLIKKDELLSGFIDLDTQLTPAGFDLTVAQLFEFKSCGALDFSNKERKLPQTVMIKPRKAKQADKFGWWKLEKGCYKVMTNETVKLPNDLIAFAFSRSSLLRMGVFVQTAAWDAGFQGRSEFILVVENKAGLRLKENARVAQLVFFRTAKTTQGYQGIYQNL